MRKGEAYTFAFAAIICVICSLLLSVASAGLRARQEKMIELDRQMNVLKAFGVPITTPDGRKIAAKDVERMFAEHIRDVVLDAETGEVIPDLRVSQLSRDDLEKKRRLPLYQWVEDGEVTKYAFPISGKGLWSTIYGYLALERDLRTIAGITFYRHGETPGLGGEIERDWFQNQFRGKKVFADGRLLPFEVVKGRVSDRYPQGNDHAVDGISGASMTGQGLTQFLRNDLQLYEKYFSSIRKG
jgi:Na+-transporting NADH:ubiquinone oxidoreductase subunit C